jgi:hypothetical protein
MLNLKFRNSPGAKRHLYQVVQNQQTSLISFYQQFYLSARAIGFDQAIHQVVASIHYFHQPSGG